MVGIWNRIVRKIIRVSQRVRGVQDEAEYFWTEEITDASLDADVQYVVKTADTYTDSIQKLQKKLPGQHVLELGPGKNLGSLLMLAGLGSHIWTADRFLVRWRQHYHPAFYDRLRDWLRANRPQVSVEPIERILAKKNHEAACKFLFLPCENLHEIPTGSMDITLSNAVLEHLSDPLQSFKEMARITRSGGVGAHQVDFRYHPSFDKPLEHLLLSRQKFDAIWKDAKGSCGCQWRREDYQQWIDQVGMEVVQYNANWFASEEYLNDFEPRLRAAAESPYRTWTRKALRETSGQFLWRKR